MKKCLLVTMAIILSLSSLAFSLPRPASAVSGADWKPGRIIDDDIFTDRNGMSANQIQDFLAQKVGTGGYDSVPGSCDSEGVRRADPYSSSTRAQYAASLGRPSRFTCLKDYYEVPKTTPGPGIPANNYGGAPIPSGARSAAQLIWDAAQSHNINPKVLLVMLQKESAGPLTTDDWPFQKQYTYAMGAYCPDSGPNGAANCDENYAGFSIQISESAALLRWYLDNMEQPWWRYKKLGDNNILYQNAKPECGSSIVNITTKATAALYTYTPYQPNQAALNNMYGLGDSCSAYGNRNFWRIFFDWFGTTYSGLYAQQLFNKAHATGALVREISGGPVYKLIDGNRLIIPSYGVLISHNYKESQIKVLNRGDSGAPLSPQKLGFRSGTLLRQGGDVRIYVVECTTQFYASCTKRHVANYETYKGLGYREADIINVTGGDLIDLPNGTPISQVGIHPNGTLIRDEATNKIYLLKDGERYHILSARLFEIQRFDWSKVKAMNAYDAIAPIKTGYPAYDTNLLARPTNGVAIYAIGENGYGTTYKRHISSYQTFLLLGYSDTDVVNVEASIIDGYPSIPPY